MIIVWALLTVLGVSFLLIVFRGAPFVPTLRRDLEGLFELHSFKKNELLVDLGSGDGRVLAAAAANGVRAVGFELNPFLVWFSKIKLRGLRPQPNVRLADFWTTALPDETVVVFVFLAKPFMRRLDAKLEDEARRLGRDIKLVSYGIKIPGKTPEASSGALIVYRYTA